MSKKPGSADDDLLSRRIVFLRDPIDDEVANQTMARLLFLQHQDPKREIQLYINSPGGSVTATLAIHDTIGFVGCDVATCVMGQAASMACLIAAAGAKGRRTATPNARIMVHQPWGHVVAPTPAEQATFDEEIGRLRRAVLQLFVKHTRQTEALLAREIEIDQYLSPQRAQGLGIIDRVLPANARGTKPLARPREGARALEICGEIDDALANEVALDILRLEHGGSAEEIRIEIDSPGGSVTASLMLYDLIRHVRSPVVTVAKGEADGTACLLLAAGDRRLSHATARIGFADVWGGAQGSASDIEIQEQEIRRLKSALCDAFALHTGRPATQIASEFGRGVELSAEEARAYGLVDEVIP